ncbi:uncharacterized protein LOC121241244 [Juglans microcarpa x Juglans regia]|uniref:uncharacterized protein LOC121241244 n=1 Tax=Juglans microcarpa x Juglans regia TaxID=2249226 RepID=UPI001B7E81E3|nr:uncharacterized protein LOC121241244 [Juglans microcarpa x Juglans regia]
MQAVKDKLQDMNAMRKAKAAVKEEEMAEKDLAKAKMEVAHKVRLAKEAEAAMELHAVARAGEKAERDRRYPSMPPRIQMPAPVSTRRTRVLWHLEIVALLMELASLLILVDKEIYIYIHTHKNSSFFVPLIQTFPD